MPFTSHVPDDLLLAGHAHTRAAAESLGVGFPRHVVSGAVVRLWLEGKYSA
jgi:hypothetical protein